MDHLNAFLPRILRKYEKQLREIKSKLGPPLVPSEETCNNHIKGIKKYKSIGKFFWVHNLHSGGLENPHNIQAILGRTTISYEEWITLIHPTYLSRYIQFGLKAYNMLYAELKDEMDFLSHSYIIQIPIRDNSDGYTWYTQISKPFRFDENGNMVAQLNCYIPSRPFSDEESEIHITPMIKDKVEKRRLDWEKIIIEDVGTNLFDEVLGEFFTEAEIDVIECAAKGCTAEEIAAILLKKPSTVYKQTQSLLKKARNHFNQDFKNLAEFSTYCRIRGIV